MKTIFFAKILVAVAFGLGALSASAQGAKIGVIDMKKAFFSYYKTVQSEAAFSTERETMTKKHKDMLDDARLAEEQLRKLTESANDMAVSKEQRDRAKAAADEKYRDLATRKDAIDQYDRQAMSLYEEERRQKTDALMTEVKEHLSAQAKAGGYNLVLDVSGLSANTIPVAVYASGLPDLTEGLLKELNAEAPASFTPPSGGH